MLSMSRPACSYRDETQMPLDIEVSNTYHEKCIYLPPQSVVDLVLLFQCSAVQRKAEV